jgi:L-amino acid N-acyltransferase YncA
MVRLMHPADNVSVLEIYRMGLESRNATFETVVPEWKEWDSRHLSHSRFVYEENHIIKGWIALSPFSVREVYCGVAEVSIYVDPHFQRRGIGSLLMEKMIISSEMFGIWSLVSTVFPENEATLKLHTKFGFRLIGRREKIARLDGKWKDTFLFERRSPGIL